MRRLVLGLVALASVMAIAASVSARGIGVILMHGNTDSPDGTIAQLAAALKDAGYLVERPEMCWSGRRKRDRPLLDCLAELEGPIARLASQGAHSIVVAGMSQGGLGALVFGARRSGLAGIIALAPNGDPQHVVRIFPQIAESVARAHALVTEGRGNERASFTDGNIRGLFAIETTPTIYLSFFDPAGPADMLANTMQLREPVLWVAGTQDRSQVGPTFAFDRAPANPLNRYVTVNSDHLGTPSASREATLVWLKELESSMPSH